MGRPNSHELISLTPACLPAISLLPMLLLLLSYVEGLDEAHEATHTFVTALVTALQAGAAAGWMTSQGGRRCAAAADLSPSPALCAHPSEQAVDFVDSTPGYLSGPL